MAILKQGRDWAARLLLGANSVPSGLFDSREYFRNYGPIHFSYSKDGDLIVAQSKDFRLGSIITSGRNKEELDANIRDAILTAFGIPSSYAKEAKIQRVGVAEEQEYALA